MHWLSQGHWIWMVIWWIVAIYFIVAGVMFVADAFRGRRKALESPESILRRRYAAGEIDTEEFERRLAVLRDTRDAA
ncbi:MAG TPA: SHOCT domain-containing protein [Terriglobia bacterium]|nr:SHOCT domain-containing protein [Terriglobia bacterium]